MTNLDDSGYHTASDFEYDEVESLRKVLPARNSAKESDGEDLGHYSRKLQSSAFISDLQHGLSFNNALTRLQTMKALMEQVVSDAIDNNVESDDDFHDCASSDESLEDKGVEVPKGITRVTTPKLIPMYNDVVIPQDKYPDDVTHDDNTDHEMELAELEPLTLISSHEKKDHKILRSRIKQINDLKVQPKQKAMMIQKLMMGNVRIANGQAETGCSHENDNKDLVSIQSMMTAEDLQPEFQRPGVLGCSHYQRACKLLCGICNKWVTCRLCHDELHHDNPHLWDKDRIHWIMCMRCQNVQRPSRTCGKCLEEFASYCCEKCKLYDNDDAKDIYHCDKCGICRLGLGLGLDFFHCDGCQACLSIELQDNHKCIERATMSNCPICGDYMFTSVKPVVYMSPCGHAIHQHCFDEYTRHSYKCPHCQVTVLNMDAQFRVLDKEIEEQPLPEPYSNWMCIVSCNDCKGRSKCNYHILGLKCGHCLSYNTIQVKLIKPENGEEEDHVNSATLEQFSHSMNHSLSENLLRDHFQTEDISPIINMDNSMLSNFDQYMNEYFKEAHFDRNKESHHVNDFINTKNFWRPDKKKNETESSEMGTESQSMSRVGSLTGRFKQLIGDNLPVQKSITDVLQMWRQDSNETQSVPQEQSSHDSSK